MMVLSEPNYFEPKLYLITVQLPERTNYKGHVFIIRTISNAMKALLNFAFVRNISVMELQTAQMEKMSCYLNVSPPFLPLLQWNVKRKIFSMWM